MDVIEMLTEFNLTRQEAAIYLTLMSDGELTGYEVAKLTGISRSNAYTSLAALVEKGAAFTIEDTATRYTPVPVAEFCDNKIGMMQKAKNELITCMPQRKEEAEGYITIKGQAHIVNKMRNMILRARERVYLSASNETLENILTEIRTGIERGLKIVLITDKPLELDGATVYTVEKQQYPIRLIADSANVLTGGINGADSTCLYSRKKNLVDLLKDSLKNEIRLVEMIKGRDER
ncbi:MAG: helix-turn-helix domain-containing protein [Bacillota bacterium]|nr:helix-turn-helix domain-containing protein [Bacillota bacterium]